jgi:Domain of unknown function (DUF1707)/2TM domain
MRASDADRELLLEQLSAAAAAGRLDDEEFEQRAGAALRAKVLDDIEALRDDLPSAPEPAGREMGARAAAWRAGLRAHTRVFAAVNLGLAVIWALDGLGYFWPVWPFMGWGIGLVVHAACNPGRDSAWASASRSRHRRRGTASS